MPPLVPSSEADDREMEVVLDANGDIPEQQLEVTFADTGSSPAITLAPGGNWPALASLPQADAQTLREGPPHQVSGHGSLAPTGFPNRISISFSYSGCLSGRPGKPMRSINCQKRGWSLNSSMISGERIAKGSLLPVFPLPQSAETQTPNPSLQGRREPLQTQWRARKPDRLLP